MAFLDHVKLNIKAGRGGDGVVRWRRERAIAMGGPAGGDGGRGGHVYIVGQRNMHTLHNYAQSKEFAAENGFAGGNKNMHGANGKDMYLTFPLGSEIYIEEYDRTIELLEEGQTELLFNGGQGGMGNSQFKSSTNRSPEEFTAGKNGEFGTVTVNLKFIAEVGLIGYPNAGKSSLLNALTNSQSKVANYNFTTLEPHLGDFFGHILADIPGLIEGASEGKGLGIKFLKHVERTGFLVHLIDASSKNYVKDYLTIRKEMGKFNPELLDKKEIVIISKVDNLGVDLNLLLDKKVVSKKEKIVKVKKLTKAQIAKLSKEEKQFLKLQEQEEKKLIKEADLKKKFEILVVKTFKTNKAALEKEINKKSKKKVEVQALSLYDDKSLKNFIDILKKVLKK